MSDRFTLESSSLPDGARLVSFRGVEALCRPYEIEVHFVVPDPQSFDMADMIGARGTLIGDLGDGSAPFKRHGVFLSVKLLLARPDGALVQAVLGPRVAQLAMSQRSRLFTKRSVPQVFEDVFEEAGFTAADYDLRLRGTYDPEEHVCQYAESDLAFLHRWMEVEGLYYFFEHGDDEERMIVTDDKSAHRPASQAPVRYHPVAAHDASAGASFSSFTCQRVALPASVTVRDYDYARPTLEMVGSASVSPTGYGEVNIHNGRFFTIDKGRRLARVRAEELSASEVSFVASGTVTHVGAGLTFTLEEHPMSSLNGEYLATRVSFEGTLSAATGEMRRLLGLQHEETFRSSVDAISSSVQFRPRRATQWPRVYGFEAGVIDGSSDSEYAQIDDQGRYLVKLKFDESDLKDGKASTWVRMMQPHGGGVEGWHFPLRKGTEVIIQFLGGDPDRPVISGVVPNAHTPSPVTAHNNTTNIIQTGGRNRLELEDRDGSQRFTMYSPTEETMIRLGAPNDKFNLKLYTKGNARTEVGGFSEIELRGSVTEHIHQFWDLSVQGDVKEVFHSGQSTTVTSQNLDIDVQQGSLNAKAKTDLTLHADGQRIDTVGEVWREEIRLAGRDATLIGEDVVKVTSGGGLHEYETGFNLKVTGGDIALKAPAGALDIDTGTGLRARTLGAIDLWSRGDFLVSCNDSDIKNRGNKQEFTCGATYAFALGAKAEFAISGSFSMSASVSLSLATGMKVDLFAGPSFGTKSIDMEFCSVKVDTISAWLKTHNLNITSSVLTVL